MVKNLPARAGDARDMGSIPGLGRSPEEGKGNPLQSSWLGNFMDREAWWAAIPGVTESGTQLSSHRVQHNEMNVNVSLPISVPAASSHHRLLPLKELNS